MEKTKEIKGSKKEESLSIKIKQYVKNLFDFSKYDKKTIFFMILFVFLFLVSISILYYNYFIDSTFLYRLIIQYFVNPIFELGILGIFLFLFIMAIQAVIVPIPSEILLIAAGIIWGVFLGGIIGILGSMISAILAYYIARKGGRPLAEKFVGESKLEVMDKLIQKYGTGFIIVARFLPFVAFDPISYASGVLKVPPKKYIIGTLIGLIPRAFFYAWLGASLGIRPPVNPNDIDPNQGPVELFNAILLFILVFLILGFLIYYLIMKHLEKKGIKMKKPFREEKGNIADERENNEEDRGKTPLNNS